ncbi:MAG: polyprenyl synthetase family protein [Desulfurococcales archaeon]|nr:polyprenyl synthetase family protein [Desulfurococcales archaeon]
MDEGLSNRLKDLAVLVNTYLAEKLRGAPENVYMAATHLIRAGGKRVRPAVTLATAKMLGGGEAVARALPLAAAVEVLHNFTLIHDDIMDQDEYRRGVPTVHKVWGVPMAILAGDLLYAYTFRMALESRDNGLKPRRTIYALKILADASVKVSEGQAYDMMYEDRWDVDVDDYLKMVYLKTAALIEASAMLGAIAGNADRSLVALMGEYGKLVGLAFQIRDDILGVFGDPKKTGKPVYSDLRRGKKTLLLIYTVRKLGGYEEVSKMLSEGKYDEVAELIKESGALSYAEDLARRYMERAVEIIDSIDELEVRDEESRSFLSSLARFVVEREK